MLNRQESEGLQIGPITLKFERVRGRRVRVAIAAPQEFRVDRLDAAGEVVAPKNPPREPGRCS